MLSGRAVFAHDSVAETIGALVTQDPQWDLLPPETPPAVRQLLKRCLERDPRNRLRDIGEARILLTNGSLDAPQERVPAGSRSWLAASALLTIGALGGGALLWLIARDATPAEAAIDAGVTLRRLTELPGPELQPDITPDGRHVLFASAASGNYDIYLLRVGGARPLNLTADSPADDHQAAFSFDGERIAFRSERNDGGIFVMGATGESVRRVTAGGYDPAWSPDGRSLAYATEPVVDPYARYGKSDLWVVEIASGQPARLVDTDAVQPAWSPDGSRIAYWANTGGQRDIWTVSARGGTPVAVTSDAATDWSPEWSPDGTWLYFSSDRGGNMNIWRVAIDQRTGASAGVPQPVTSSFTGVGYIRFAADHRRAVVMAYSASHELLLNRVNPAGSGTGESLGAVRSTSLGWCSPSPNADWLACTSRTAQEDIVLMRPDGSETVRLTDDPPKDRNPSWSPDGNRIAFMSTRTGTWELWSVRSDGSDLRQMTDLPSDIYETVWSRDGHRALTASTVRSPAGTWVFDASSLATRANATLFEHPGGQTFSAEAWSPDDRFVAGSILDGSGSPRHPALWDISSGSVRVFDVPPPLDRFSFAVGGWLPGGRRFLFASGRGLVSVDAATGAWTSFAAPENGIRYRLSADGRTLLSERDTIDADVWLMEIGR